MEGLRQDVTTRCKRMAWEMLIRQCLTATRGSDALRNDIRRFLENHHHGLGPSIDDYPYILAVVDKYRK